MAGPNDPELLYEPKFPDTREYPEYDTLNVRIQGYDFTHIEKFQGYVDRMARRFNFKVLESYAVAAQTQRVVTYKPNSTIVDNEVNLALYDRVLRLGNVPAPHLQLFISLIQTHLPVGVTVTFKEHEKADEDYRYIPDILLKQKQEELKALDDPVIRCFIRRLYLLRSYNIRRMSNEIVEPLVPYELVDIGANLGHPSYKEDLNDVLKRAKQAGLSKVMITGTCEKVSVECKKLAETMPGFLYFTAGVHPHDAKDFNENSLNTLRELQSHEQCVAVGECGLDFNRNFSPQDVQKEVFRKQVELACELNKPLFIHEREAHEDMVRILGDAGERLPPAVIHCFTGTEDEAKKYVDLGYYIGLTGFLWKDRLPNGVQVALRNGSIPLDRLLIETDAPFMYPKINDKKLPADVKDAISDSAKQLHKFASFNRNEPCALAAICEMIAAFMGKDPREVAEATTKNAKRVYGLN
ncbi:hydrolase, TatD family [Ancylostoma ceylanicum]|uniref:Deoxyribonuclease TATDN1 n=2 Tax=Ancylostoma ceylanicum TaxID=53326 RepID=A0A0D6M722_9BILA|nr:hydrolase, TatD family [Ancylostoma ceylanicum]